MERGLLLRIGEPIVWPMPWPKGLLPGGKQLSKAIGRLLSSEMAAVRCAAGILAAATHRANNYAVATLDGSSNTVNVSMHDATGAFSQVWHKKASCGDRRRAS